MADPIDFYFDFASPYGYFASLRIDELARAHGCRVTWHPILLGAIFKVTGMKPNLEQPLRGEYLSHDVGRIARLIGAPFTLPDSAPVNGVAASRAFYWLADDQPEQAKALARALYHAHFAEGRDIGPADTVAEIAVQALAGAVGDRAAVLAALGNPTVKDRLRAETEQAVARGVFGSPFVLVGNEPFWGWDRLDMVDRWLSNGGW
ncbi:2-hydroxychromene-2-carboxylate isomerase [Azospirillum griseum]|uniref:2-hydroxychromene-2-carboxylate isomerase n=1 Tax=Azospirillum griseum TaxID=2496639 RepID=A0A431VIJ9_9PROT|nr:2-hydroxychromene-2-carboxylate isomerase [Azospirillum griseum]RTR19904.1 2-hydroxychromene-2-carboxylate isomerase [Azospirillum griseum]